MLLGSRGPVYLAEAESGDSRWTERGSIVFGHMEVYIDHDMNSFILYEVL